MSDLAPGFLVASPSLRCPFFNHSLVLMVDHGEEGSFGFVVNKAAPVEFASLQQELELGLAEIDLPIMQGGPVSPETGWILFDPSGLDALPDDAIELSSCLAVTSSLKLLREIALGQTSCPSVLSLGYSGWSDGQLEDEMSAGSWIPVDLDPRLVFEVALEDRWTRALETLGIDPGRVVDLDAAQA